MISRRAFLAAAAGFAAPRAFAAPATFVHTVLGPVPLSELGMTLTHEHILVDFGGADVANPGRYNTADVIEAALPKLNELKAAGCRTFVDCTPNYLGRDPAMLRRIAEACGLNIITNTGYYGASGGKYLPAHTHTETPEQLAARWIREAEEGIDGTGIRPGFMKIGVNPGALSTIAHKLIVAAALCHKKTGLRMHVHTGDGAATMDIIETLRAQSVRPDAYVWVHAQNEKDPAVHVKAARAGAWVSLDGIGEKTLDDHLDAVQALAEAGYLNHVLVSQDSGWYHVGAPGGGDFRGYTFLFEKFLPALRTRGFTETQIRMLMVENPARALTVLSGSSAVLPKPPAPKPSPPKKRRRRAAPSRRVRL